MLLALLACWPVACAPLYTASFFFGGDFFLVRCPFCAKNAEGQRFSKVSSIAFLDVLVGSGPNVMAPSHQQPHMQALAGYPGGGIHALVLSGVVGFAWRCPSLHVAAAALQTDA